MGREGGRVDGGALIRGERRLQFGTRFQKGERGDTIEKRKR